MERAADSDGELVERCRHGDRDAFDLLVRHHHTAAWRVARRYVATGDEADDLTQEAFVLAYDRLAQLTEPERFGAWLTSIVRNLARMWLRHRSTQPPLLSLDEESGAARTEQVSAAAAREASRLDSVREVVAAALAALPPEQRRAIQLHYLDGYRYHEVALLLGVSVGAVRGRLDRARQVLRRELQEMEAPMTSGWELGARELDALRDAALFAITDPTKAVLDTLYLTGEGEVVATDTHRVFCGATAGLEGIPLTLVHADLGRTLRADHPGCRRGRLIVQEGEAILRLDGGEEIRAPLVEGTFPRWERVVPDTFAYRAVARAGDWLAALAMLAALREREDAGCDPAGDGLPRVLVRLSPSETRIILSAGGVPDGERRIGWEASTSFTACFTAGEEDFTIAANPHYVEQAIHALRVADDADVEFAAVAELRPFLIRAHRNGRTFVATMPMARDWPPAPAAEAATPGAGA
ncbi:MAG: sigma-70 family RNA polymerase sigma factor [Armatimonadetes bacterium]|nr:sigma-70 family RNA polymerase sigma factor [Armatimonadota bacterium]